ncbi:PrpF domain-containing protein [Jiangella asiatica]|uniref:3-methylitaconate isomerase n=1 Tax=Jiangella asiatica TaxID=2530372 RepID=A0A4R5DHE5_9ACTN|nr:PrpF domain-containing protein [Jiangella asiatica]TDE13492.1 hypothetical protein E1269_05525 [Jiangella asiatica]
MTAPRESETIPAVIMRGGTSRGVFVHRRDVPAPGPRRDRLMLDLLGTADPTRIDGLGSTLSSTNKVMIVGPSDRPGLDVDYLFVQGLIDRDGVDYAGNCGNLTAAVGAFAVDEGLVEAAEPVTPVRLWNENTGRRIVAHVPVRDGRAAGDGDFTIAGVSRPGARIRNEYLDPAGSTLGALLPTGAPLDLLDVPGLGAVEVSIVDVTNPFVFVRAEDVGLAVRADDAGLVGGLTAPAAELNADPALLERLEAVRAQAAVRVGLAGTAAAARVTSANLPKIAVVAAPADYRAASGSLVAARDIDLVARMVSMGAVHHAFAMTGVMCLAVAARLPGTVPRRVAVGRGLDDVAVGHQRGVTTAEPAFDADGAVRSVTVDRTARRLMSGLAHLPVPAGTAGRTGRAAAR